MDRARVANGQRGPARRGVQAPPDASAPARRESFREHKVKIPAATSGQEMHCDAPFFMRASACRNCKTRRPAKLKRASEAKKGGSECTHSAPTALDGRRCIVGTGRALKSRVVSTGPAPGPSTSLAKMTAQREALDGRNIDCRKKLPVSRVWFHHFIRALIEHR